eukprot:scaffold2220_cov75-Cylindrotheca_fusiformis.AAC.6
MPFPINALETKNGDPVPDPKSQLAGKVVALWCPACQIFTPLLSVLHEEAQENNIDFEVIYVSSDHSAEESLEYRKAKHGEWYSIPFEQTAAYKIKYGVFAGKEQSTFSDTERRSGIPTLVIVDPTGKEMDLLDCDDNKVIQEIEGKGTAFLKRWEAFKW